MSEFLVCFISSGIQVLTFKAVNWAIVLLLLVPTLKQPSCHVTESQRNRICVDDSGQWAGGKHSLHRQKPRYKIHISSQCNLCSSRFLFLKNYSPETTLTDLTRCSPTDRCHNTSSQSQQPSHDNPRGIKNKSIFIVQNIKTQRRSRSSL